MILRNPDGEALQGGGPKVGGLSVLSLSEVRLQSCNLLPPTQEEVCSDEKQKNQKLCEKSLGRTGNLVGES
ncbi:hypothetical protein GOP47_0012850 [Adiantum capillus-veneris]|uniref:Uncharacterized protein n=1 Tax=Adiantum capillus-veneris TaxID=13818 RepID=A0A9D4ZES9_ADICA|nr:hypothetical protein GOP47_0012850 [Adiantum capillus-veneris]